MVGLRNPPQLIIDFLLIFFFGCLLKVRRIPKLLIFFSLDDYLDDESDVLHNADNLIFLPFMHF